MASGYTADMARRIHPAGPAARLLAALAFGFMPSAASAQIADLGVPAVTKLWEAEHVDDGPPALLDHARLMTRLDAAVKEGAGLYQMEEIGRSVEGRSIEHLWFGSGPMHVLLWSQMHGDEATATSALLDILHLVALHRADAPIQRLLDKLTIHFVPMVNPDGAERWQRRNAQGLDINRDALLLQSPEGRALKALRDRLQPSLGFNLHNENWRTSAGKTMPATISLLADAFDEAGTETPAACWPSAPAPSSGSRWRRWCRDRSRGTTRTSRCARSGTTSPSGGRRSC